MLGKRTDAAGERIPLVTTMAVAIAALCDFPAYVGFGGVSGSAILTALVALFGIVSLPSLIAAPRGAVRPLLPFALLAIWSTFLAIVLGTSVGGFQTILIFWLFVSVAMLTASYTGSLGLERLRRQLVMIGWIIGTGYALILVSGGLGASGFFGRRSFALEALVLMAATVPYVINSSKWARNLPIFLAALMTASLSRTAIVAGALLLTIRASLSHQGFRRNRFLALGFLALAAVIGAVLTIPFVRERFTGGDQAFQVGGIVISSQGRDKIWAAVLQGALRSPLIGQGPGSVKLQVASLIPGQAEPHNDFLRVYFDAGLIGLALFLWALLALFTATAKRARRAPTQIEAAPHLSALLALVVFVFGCLTDNPLVYPFVVAPLAVIVGISLATPLPQKLNTMKSDRAKWRTIPVSASAANGTYTQ